MTNMMPAISYCGSFTSKVAKMAPKHLKGLWENQDEKKLLDRISSQGAE